MGAGCSSAVTHSAFGRSAGGDEPQPLGDHGGVDAEQLQAFDGAAGVAFLVVDVDDVVACGEFGGDAAQRQPCFAALGFAEDGVFAAGVDQSQPVGAGDAERRFGGG